MFFFNLAFGRLFLSSSSFHLPVDESTTFSFFMNVKELLFIFLRNAPFIFRQVTKYDNSVHSSVVFGEKKTTIPLVFRFDALKYDVYLKMQIYWMVHLR